MYLFVGFPDLHLVMFGQSQVKVPIDFLTDEKYNMLILGHSEKQEQQPGRDGGHQKPGMSSAAGSSNLTPTKSSTAALHPTPMVPTLKIHLWRVSAHH